MFMANLSVAVWISGSHFQVHGALSRHVWLPIMGMQQDTPPVLYSNLQQNKEPTPFANIG